MPEPFPLELKFNFNHFKLTKAKIMRIIIFIIVLAVVTACEDFLNEDLRDKIAVENFFNNDQEAILAVNGLYRILHRPSLYFQIEDYYAKGADEMGNSRDAGDGAIDYKYLYAEGVGDGLEQWSSLYELVRNSNLAIENIDGNQNLSESIRDRSLGEALFMRAFAYYHLTNLWGDVPYFRELLNLEELGSLEREKKDIIRADMKQDLQWAFELLPTSYPTSELGRATKWAALTLKGKLQLFDQEWNLAFEDFRKVIDESPHKLLDKFEDVHDQSNPNNQFNDEIIFVVDFKKDPVYSDGSTLRTNHFNPRIRDEPKIRTQRNNFAAALAARNEDFTGTGLNIPLPELANQSNWEEGDLRYEATIITEYLGFELNFPYFRKMWNLNQETSPRHNHPANVVVMRLADVYLMAAEAQNELNGPEGAYVYVNKVRERAFNPDKPWAGMSQEEFRQAMYQERKFELAAEGHRRIDLIRWGILLETVIKTEQYPWNNPADNIKPHHVLLPIPLEEIKLNPNLLKSDPTNNGYR
jgi:hypothetical protein